jgi:hypothetical protein
VEGGQLIVCEAFRKWWDADASQNLLVALLESNGFTVQSTSGASPTDSDEVFQYVVCQKAYDTIKIQ